MVRYTVCGLSNRALAMFVLPMLNDPERELGLPVAIVDPDAARVEEFARRFAHGEKIQHYLPEQFETMVAEVGPDTIIVTSPDHTHSGYILAALAHDIDVITEKPMVSTAEDARRVLAAEAASRASVRVAHNLRYSPRHQQIKRLLQGGAVGRVTHVNLAWQVDVRHGASYFYRWNRMRALSGGLSVHKSCHHLDLVNWWLDERPVEVFGYGALNHYGSGGDLVLPADALAPTSGSALNSTSVTARVDHHGLPYYVQYEPDSELTIHDAEIDIEDTYSAVVRYRGGQSLAYSVDFASPWEGYRLIISGTGGQLAADFCLQSDDSVPDTVVVRDFENPATVYEFARVTGAHDGADEPARRDLLLGASEASRELGLTADSSDGAYAVAVGEALWRSVREKRAVDVEKLLSGA
ncbi:putative dehydrogenase [Catenulispora sp. GAS73]|uniref:Gfo/Idh/MocA family protein n=1 Tax=Catenulispora sp. GAS73 TaxID=3156269 RepID=UPI00351595B0